MPGLPRSPMLQQGQEEELLWRLLLEDSENKQQGSREALKNEPLIDTMSDAGMNYDVARQSVDRMGKSATFGQEQAMATQARQAEEERRKEFERQQQEAIKRLQDQQKQWQEQLQRQYGGSTGFYGQPFTGEAYQIAQLARMAGFPESEIATAVAVAMAESGGRADAVNSSNRNGSIDRGLMQINSIHKGLLSQYDPFDPLQNMQMAYQIWKNAGGKWTPWSAYNNGSYQKFSQIGIQGASYIQPANIDPYLSSGANGLRSAIVDRAQQYLGLPYIWGGTDLSKGVDCSGLVQSVYKQFGIQLPRVSRDQSMAGVRTSISKLLPGDLVAFSPDLSNASVNHIAIYMGNGMILESPQKGGHVQIKALPKYASVFGVHLPNLDRGSNGFPF